MQTTDNTKKILEQVARRSAQATYGGGWVAQSVERNGYVRWGVSTEEWPDVFNVVPAHLDRLGFGYGASQEDAEYIALMRDAGPKMQAALSALLDECDTASTLTADRIREIVAQHMQ